MRVRSKCSRIINLNSRKFYSNYCSVLCRIKLDIFQMIACIGILNKNIIVKIICNLNVSSEFMSLCDLRATHGTV